MIRGLLFSVAKAGIELVTIITVLNFLRYLAGA